jgi:hypothetical protein
MRRVVPGALTAEVVISLAVVVSLVLGACTAPPETTSQNSASSPTIASVASADEPNQPLSLVVFAELDQPVDAAQRQGDPAIYLISRSGTVHRFVNGALERELALDISDLTEGDGERGLLGLAFSPDGGVAYLNYTNRDGDTTIASMAVDARGMFDRGTLQTLLTIAQPYANHNAGDVVVETNGALLVPMGDGGSADDPLRVSLDDSSLLGKVLRADPRDGAVTVLAKGLRNPWRVDLHNDRLWMADVGQNKWEEVSVLDAVASRTGSTVVDFGWSAYEANDRFNDDQFSPNHVPPVVAYQHGDDGCSVSGGAVAVSGALRDRYVFADYCSGRVWSIATNESRPEKVLHFDDLDAPVAVVRVGDKLLVLSLSGTVWQLQG